MNARSAEHVLDAVRKFAVDHRAAERAHTDLGPIASRYRDGKAARDEYDPALKRYNDAMRASARAMRAAIVAIEAYDADAQANVPAADARLSSGGDPGCERPWLALVHGAPLVNKAGTSRRYTSKAAALKAANRVLTFEAGRK